MWVAMPESKAEPDLWLVAFEVEDCNGTKGYVRLIADGLLEEEARLIAQRLNG